MTKAWNPITQEELHFDALTPPEYAVAYGHCTTTGLASRFFAACHDRTLPALYETLPFTRGRVSVACGDWITSTTSTTKE